MDTETVLMDGASVTRALARWILLQPLTENTDPDAYMHMHVHVKRSRGTLCPATPLPPPYTPQDQHLLSNLRAVNEPNANGAAGSAGGRRQTEVETQRTPPHTLRQACSHTHKHTHTHQSTRHI